MTTLNLTTGLDQLDTLIAYKGKAEADGRNYYGYLLGMAILQLADDLRQAHPASYRLRDHLALIRLSPEGHRHGLAG